MGYFLEEASDGSIMFRKDRGRNAKKYDIKRYKRIQKIKKTSKRINRKKRK